MKSLLPRVFSLTAADPLERDVLGASTGLEIVKAQTFFNFPLTSLFALFF